MNPRPTPATPQPEQDLAEYYQSHKGDVSSWAERPRPLRRKRGEGPTTTFAVRLTSGELSQLQAAASKRNVSLSEFIRSTSLAATRDSATRLAELEALFMSLSSQLEDFRHIPEGSTQT